MQSGTASTAFVQAFVQLKAVEPTVFFVQTSQGLKQAVDLAIHNAGEPTEATVTISFQSQELQVGIR